MVIGIKRCKIGISKPIAIPAITGASTATKATLLINSVMNNIMVIKRMKESGFYGEYLNEKPDLFQYLI